MREDLLQHIDNHHGGLQRYRNALFSLLSIMPYVVKGQEWRAIVSNFTEFFSRSAMDWEKFTREMRRLLTSEQGLPFQSRWSPRARRACVFCARLLWQEELFDLFLAGPECFMKSPERVADLLAWEEYSAHWSDIPVEELKASAVDLRLGATDEFRLVLLHKRRVNEAQASGNQKVFVCADCHEAFCPPAPWMYKYALANHLWLGRWDPLFREAISNLCHHSRIGARSDHESCAPPRGSRLKPW